MNSQISISIDNNTITVVSPYSAVNNVAFRELGGKFADGAWRLPDNDSSRSRLAELFGSKSDEVDALVSADTLYGDVHQVGGYVLAERRGRDWAVRLATGVSLASGGFPSSGGSRANPSVSAHSGTVYRLRCRRSFAEAHGLEIAPATVTTSSIEI